MRFVIVRSLPLSSTSEQAWREVDGIYAARSRTLPDGVVELFHSTTTDFILNLGNSQFTYRDDEVPVVNQGEDIVPLLWPGLTRELFGDLMPPQPTTFPADVWIKAPGRAGRGKFLENTHQGLLLPRHWDWQVHVEGQEFRIITVGDKIIQQFQRHGANGNRSYTWLPREELNDSLKQLIQTAVYRIPGLNLIAWDTILTEEGDAYLFEGNSCPGMSFNTAQRALLAIRERI